MENKGEKRNASPLSQSNSRFPACQSALPESIGALWSVPPLHGKFYRGHAHYACQRTPRQTSGLPAGAEPSIEDEIILPLTTRVGHHKAFHQANDHTPVVLPQAVLWHALAHI